MTDRATQLGNAILAMTFSTRIAKTQTFTRPMADFPDVSILTMLAHGAQRKVNDACGGADKTATEKVSIAEAVIADLIAGVVSKRRTATGADAETLAARKVMRGLLPALLDKESLRTFRALEPIDQLSKLDGWIEANMADAEFEAAVIAEMERAEREAAQAAKIGSKLKISL